MANRKGGTATRKAPGPAPVPDVMDVRQLSAYLGIGKSKIYGLLRQEKIPAARIGRQYRFHKSIIDAWLKEKSTSATEGQLSLFEAGKGVTQPSG